MSSYQIIVKCGHPGCDWQSVPDTHAGAMRAYKKHVDSNPHRDFFDVALPFDDPPF